MADNPTVPHPETGEEVELPVDVFDDPGAVEHPDQTVNPQ